MEEQDKDEIFKKNKELLNILTYDDLTLDLDEKGIPLRHIHSRSFVITKTIQGLYVDKDKLKLLWDKINEAGRLIIESENIQNDKQTRFNNSEEAFDLLQEIGIELKQDLEDLGLTKKQGE